MPERQDLETLLLDNLPVVERVAAAICRRHGLSRDDADEFTSSVKERLVADDYAVLRHFRGEASIRTYLSVVVAMLFREYRAQHWGRWRSSAPALALGPVAVRLEALTYRDGHPLEQAIAILRSSGTCDLTHRELVELHGRLPIRRPLRPIDAGPAPLLTAVGVASADDLLLAHLAEDDRDRLERGLRRAMEQLPVEDRLIVRMRYWEGSTVADVARALALPQKGLYRRLERALAVLRRALESAGLSRDEVRQMFTDVVSSD